VSDGLGNDGLQIPIVTTADTTGAHQQAEAIKKVTEAVKANNQETTKAGQTATAAFTQGASSAKEHGKEVEALAEKTGRLNV
jgi:phage host-nuclease inhibitor protein Gam